MDFATFLPPRSDDNAAKRDSNPNINRKIRFNYPFHHSINPATYQAPISMQLECVLQIAISGTAYLEDLEGTLCLLC